MHGVVVRLEGFPPFPKHSRPGLVLRLGAKGLLGSATRQGPVGDGGVVPLIDAPWPFASGAIEQDFGVTIQDCDPVLALLARQWGGVGQRRKPERRAD